MSVVILVTAGFTNVKADCITNCNSHWMVCGSNCSMMQPQYQSTCRVQCSAQAQMCFSNCSSNPNPIANCSAQLMLCSSNCNMMQPQYQSTCKTQCFAQEQACFSNRSNSATPDSMMSDLKAWGHSSPGVNQFSSTPDKAGDELKVPAPSKPAATAAQFLSLKAVEFKPVAYTKNLKTIKAAADQTPIDLTCANFPGSKLCQQFTNLDTLLNMGCSGGYCTAIWNKGALKLDDISSTYGRITSPIKSVGKDIGLAANKIADTICSYPATAGSDQESQIVLGNLVLSINLTMNTLVDIQKRAGVDPIRQCSMTYGYY